MATGQLQNVLKHLRRVLAHRRESVASDGELLERFFVSHDEEAFELLVWRHHRMVLGVCSRILADSNDVEDAFQATFLVLARKGRSIRKRGSLASWLFGVARRVALQVSRGTQRLQPARPLLPPSCPEPGDELMRQELRGILDEELGRLPEKYRAPVVLCYLEGMTYEEAAQRLGWSKGTISTRLTRARELLKSRLAGRGLAITVSSLSAWLCENAASAGASNSLVVATIKVATSMAAGQAASSAVISIKVAALAEDVVKTMLLTKLKLATTLLASCALVFVTGWSLWSAVRSAQPNDTSLPNGFAVAESKAPADDNKAPDAPSKPHAEERIKLPDPIGGIVRSPDGKPLASARVTIDLFEGNEPDSEFERRWTTTTDEKGAYRISTKDLGPLPPRWNFEIRAVAKDLPETKVLFVRAYWAAKQQKFDDVKFFAGVAVHGRILDPEGRPANGVFLHPTCMNDPWQPRATAVDDDGIFRIVLPAGADGKVMAVDMIAISAKGPPARVSVAAGADANLGEVRLDKGVVVEGRLVDEKSQPVADAIIAAQSLDSGPRRHLAEWTLAARTDKDGSFRFPSLMSGKIVLWVTDRVQAHVGGEIKTLKTNRPEVMIIPRIIELDRKAAPTLKLSLRAVPSVSIRG
ncbi:MAG TPA: sigma-70 family RNA polymerase sigma factor, partial [Gemmataceae bacterium]